MRWHRKLLAEYHTYPHRKRVGRPGLMKTIRELIVRMATENSSWGYLRISGELKKVGHTVARTNIAKTLNDNGIAPSPDRPTSWSTILKSHAGVIASADFFTVDVWTKRRLVTHYVFFVIHHANQSVRVLPNVRCCTSCDTARRSASNRVTAIARERAGLPNTHAEPVRIA